MASTEAKTLAPVPAWVDGGRTPEQLTHPAWPTHLENGSLVDLSPTRTATTSLPRRRADGRARARPVTYVEQAVREPTAHRVARSLLTGAVRAATASDVGGEGSSTGAGLVSPDAAVLRDAQVARLRARLERALDDGDLPPHADTNLLARHLVTVSSGIEAQADGGVGAGELHQVVDVALQVWPPV